MQHALDEKRLQAWARAVAESDLEAALESAATRLEEEQLFIDALRREGKVRAEEFRILGAVGRDIQAAGLYDWALARITAEAFVDADEKIDAMEQRRNQPA